MTEEAIDTKTGEIVQVTPATPEPVQNLTMMRTLVTEVAAACKGQGFVAKINNRDYPTVQWWTTVGASLGMFPYEVRSEKITDDQGNMGYESFVEVRRDGQAVTSASAICSRSENQWSKRDEYAIKSMATTRATAKAYRLGLSFLAVLSGLEATPAEEMPRDGGGFNNRANVESGGTCPEHNLTWALNRSGRYAHPIKNGDELIGWCNKEEVQARGAVGDAEQLDREADAVLGRDDA